MVYHQGTVHRCNEVGHCYIKSVLLNVLTKGQGGAIVLMKGTNL